MNMVTIFRILFLLTILTFFGAIIEASPEPFDIDYHYNMEFGFNPKGTMIIYNPYDWVDFSGSFYTDLEGTVSFFNTFYIGGGIRTEIWGLKNALSFWPHLSHYRFLTGLRFGPIEIGFRHHCTHPVVPYLALIQPIQIWEGAYEELYIRVTNK